MRESFDRAVIIAGLLAFVMYVGYALYASYKMGESLVPGQSRELMQQELPWWDGITLS